MLNLFKLNINKKTEKKTINLQENHSKHFPPSVREWNNSIYVYNKNALNLIPQVSILAIKLIKSYFNLYNYELERKIRKTRLLRRLRKLSSHRIYVSNGEFKHTNNKVLITLYLFNRQKSNYERKIRKGFIMARRNVFIISKRLELIKSKGLKSVNKANKKKFLLVKTFKLNTNSKDILSYKSLSKYVTRYYKKFVIKSLDKIRLYLYYKQFLLINKSKFNYTYLQHLKKYLEKIYNKNVEFNLVNLRRFYLNSDILSESITLKIRKNRRKLLKYLNTLKRKVKVHNKKHLYYQPLLKSYLNKNILVKKESLENVVLDNIKYKHVTGFRLEASGRLTRRYTASRSLSKLRYKGNLLNIDSSYRGLSSVLLKGNLKSNLQYTKLKGKTRIGSFGIKGWVSGN